MPDVRLIDANAYEYPGDLIHMPTIEAVPVVHGWWELENGWWRCSACREFADGSFTYCPNCGAKMDGGAEG